jgi:hypothetical protein
MIHIPEAPMKFVTLHDFVWYLHYTNAKRSDTQWHELLAQYTCDDEGVYAKASGT